MTDTDVVDRLSIQILASLKRQRAEEYYSQSDPDMMDATIKYYKERAVSLRKMREEYEDLMSNPLLRN